MVGGKGINNKRKTENVAVHTRMATKKQKVSVGAVPDVFTSADECAQAIETALAAMDPPIEVYEGIIKLIAELARPYGELYTLGLSSSEERLTTQRRFPFLCEQCASAPPKAIAGHGLTSPTTN